MSPPAVTVGAAGPARAVTVVIRPVAAVTPALPARGSVVSFWLIEEAVPPGPLMPLQPTVGAAEL